MYSMHEWVQYSEMIPLDNECLNNDLGCVELILYLTCPIF